MNHKNALLYGTEIWAFVFVTAMIAFPLHVLERPLFESIMPVALTLATVIASVKYFQTAQKKTVMVGFCLGLIWFAVSVLLDTLMFSWGPMKMTLADYIKDIAVTYLIIIVIPTGIGYILEKR